MTFGSVEGVLVSVRVRMYCSGVVRDGCVVVSGVELLACK
jgi:hypothetical protein